MNVLNHWSERSARTGQDRRKGFWTTEKGGALVLWTLFVILLVLWLAGFSFHVAGSVIHFLLVVAAIVLIYNLLTGRRVVT